MSKKDDGYSSSSFWQLIIAIPGTILAFTLLISLLAYFFGKTEAPTEPEPTPAAAEAKITEAIQPVAIVEVAAASTGIHLNKSGEEVTKNVCAMCHAAGLMQAPTIGNKEQWAPRIALGYETLVKHAIEGIRNMPARGGNADLTDTEVANAVAHMANASGASFEEIKDAAPAEAAPVDPAVAPATVESTTVEPAAS